MNIWEARVGGLILPVPRNAEIEKGWLCFLSALESQWDLNPKWSVIGI